MAHYVIETLGQSGSAQELDVFESSDSKELISKTIDALSDLSRGAFEDGIESVIAAVKDETGKFVFTAKLSFKATWLT